MKIAQTTARKGTTMLEIIKKVIIDWDPAERLIFTAPSGYEDECLEIYERYSKSDHEPLGEIIYDVFYNSFGEKFQEDLSDCMRVAQEIEKRLEK